MNREVRRALERSGKAAPKRPARKVITINPMFALDVSARNRLAATERKAMDAILEHCATKDDIEQIETLIETTIRAIGIAKDLPHLDAEGLEAALKVFNRAAWSLKHAKARHKEVGVYGLSASDRDALIQADHLVAEMRKPGVITRKTWLAAFRESYAGKGVLIPAFEELEAV